LLVKPIFHGWIQKPIILALAHSPCGISPTFSTRAKWWYENAPGFGVGASVGRPSCFTPSIYHRPTRTPFLYNPLDAMKRSTDRILTTHAGRLDGPPELRAKMGEILTGRSPDLGQKRY
jgi:hypothetical protein